MPFGNYYLLERVAVGGMAEVFLAKCFGAAGFERLVALKRILPGIAEDDEFIAMFIDEAKIAGQLSHPNIAQIFDLGKLNHSYFIAMEYVSGHDLRLIWDRARAQAKLPLALACHIAQRLCEALDYAHRRRDNRGRPLGIIHRDISPQNVLVGYDGELKVIDFGIAKASNRMVRTQTGILKGKFAYMAPEQARGEPVDHRADIFAIGVILYELVAGERAFRADTDFALLEKVRRVDVTPLRRLRPDAPRDLERILERAMSRDAKERYAWASAMAADLDRFMLDHGLACSTEELGDFVRRTFAEDYAEEQRRLSSYNAFRPAQGEGPVAPAQVDANSATLVRQEFSNLEEELRTGDDVARPALLSTLDPELSGPEPPAEGLSALGTTGTRNDDSEVFGEAVPLGLPLPWDEAAPLAPLGSTRVNIERPATGHPDPAAPDDEEDETVLDNQPVLERPRAGQGPGPRSSSSSLSSQEAPLTARVTRVGERARYEADTPTQPPLDERKLETGSRLVPHQAAPLDAARPLLRDINPRRGALMVALGFGLGVTGTLVLGALLSPPEVFLDVRPTSVMVRHGSDVVCQATPCVARLAPGRHELLFEDDQGEAVSRVVEVNEEERLVTVDLRRRVVGLRVVTDPPGAQVSLEGARLPGVTPLALPDLYGGEKVALRLEGPAGYDALDVTVEVPQVSDAPLEWRLPAQVTEFVLSAEPPDTVLRPEDGPPRRGQAKLKVPRGASRVVSLLRPGCAPQHLTLTGEGEPRVERPVALRCADFDARLTVHGTRGADLELDGVVLGRRIPMRELPLPAGEHVLVARHRGRQIVTLVEARSGETATVTVKVR